MPSPPSRPALRERYDRRQREVVDRAAVLFAEHGYQATSMSDLTEATGLASGGLYHYIGSKEQLLLRICDDLLEPLLVQAADVIAADQPATDRLRELVRTWLVHIGEHQAHMIVFAQERHVIENEPQWERVRERRKEFERLLAGLLDEVETETGHRFPDRRLTLLALLGMVNYTAQWFDPAGRLDPASIAERYCDLLLAPLSAPEIRRPPAEG